jgi:hypothetical protein
MTSWELVFKDLSKVIKKGWKVCDLGSGDQPLKEATTCVDFFEKDNWHRDGVKYKPHPTAKLVHWDLNKYPYPFKNREFDFVNASQIAEHIENPYLFCLEMQRIGKAGYIETPNKFYELLYGWEFHRWYVNVVDGRLVFENIVNRTFLGKFTHDLYHKVKNEEFRNLHDKNMDKMITRFFWEKSFKFAVYWN